jgi:hypothetical protein
MKNTNRIERVVLLEKNFPTGIPDNIGNKPLEVVNETGDTVALFYDTSFVKLIFQDASKYIKHYDQIFKYYWIDWDYDYAEDRDEDDDFPSIEELLEKGPDFEWAYAQFAPNIKWMVLLCRMTYPNLIESMDDLIDTFKNEVYSLVLYSPYDESVVELIVAFDDVLLAAKLSNTLINIGELDLSKEYFQQLIENDYAERIYENPELFFTKNNIDIFIEVANTSQIADLLAYLLDYKKKHFPAEECYS